MGLRVERAHHVRSKTPQSMLGWRERYYDRYATFDASAEEPICSHRLVINRPSSALIFRRVRFAGVHAADDALCCSRTGMFGLAADLGAAHDANVLVDYQWQAIENLMDSNVSSEQ